MEIPQIYKKRWGNNLADVRAGEVVNWNPQMDQTRLICIRHIIDKPSDIICLSWKST